MIKIIGAVDEGTSSVKISAKILDNDKPICDVKVPTRVHQITREEYNSGFFDTAIAIDFCDYAETGNLTERFYTVGGAVKSRGQIGASADWRFKYTPSVYTPAFWYGMAEMAQTLGCTSGNYELLLAVCYNVNVLSDLVRELAFPCGVGNDSTYCVKFKANGVEYQYRFKVNGDTKKGNIFIKETNASLIWKKLQDQIKGLIEDDFVLVDIGHGTTQIFQVEGGKVVQSSNFDWGIGEVQNKIERSLQAKYKLDELKNENISAYMRDAGLPQEQRRFKNSTLADDIALFLRRDGYELAHSIVSSIGQGYLGRIVLSGGGGVQLIGVIGEILHKMKSDGRISKVNLPTLLVGIKNNEFANAFGAREAILLRNEKKDA